MLPFYAAEAKERQRQSGGDHRSAEAQGSVVPNLAQPIQRNDLFTKARDQAADKVGVSHGYVQEARIRHGEILAQMARDGQRATRAANLSRSTETVLREVPTLADLNTSKRESSDAQGIAAYAETVRAWMETAKGATTAAAAPFSCPRIRFRH